ncbi:hypothetical protein AAF712_012050 [Marasmius tenuissimus]|uniref:DNA 3'-5' helicase n=1 Tax=Marasmius tenuissimus TaxID=585030 RepID=A0ABR2ZIS8_9AGAR
MPTQKSKKPQKPGPSTQTYNGKSQRKVPLSLNCVKLAEVLETHLKFKPREFQLKAIKSQLLGKDLVVHTGTGSGKTLIAAGPHLFEPKFGVTLFVSPLIGLQNKQVETFKNKFGLKAIAVNSSFSGCMPEVLRKILSGDPNIIIISPEMLLSKCFIEEVLHWPDFAHHVAAVVVDEAHIVSHWGAGFRKKYRELGMVRTFLWKEVAMVVLSATLPACIRRDVISKLQIKSTDFTLIDVGNNRPNVSLIVRPIHSTLSSFVDLDFVIPDGIQEPSSIPKTFIYYDNVMGAVDMENHLTGLLPEHLQNKRLIRLYSVAFSDKYKAKVMEDFKNGSVRVLICTDAAGMMSIQLVISGCNIPDIEVRAGRAARSPGIKGRAILLIEKAAYSVKKKTQKYAEDHGVSRGATDPKGSTIYLKAELPIEPDSENKGLHSFVQTGTQRWLWRDKYCDELYEILSNLDVSPIPPEPQGTKRKDASDDVEVAVEAHKRSHVNTSNGDHT